MILSDNKKTVLYILIAFTFSIAVRLIWVYQFQGMEQFKFNNRSIGKLEVGFLY